jgi:hypothetical protein
MAMPAGSTIEDLDIVEDIGTSQITGFVDTFADTLLLKAAVLSL